VRLGDGERDAVARPRLAQPRPTPTGHSGHARTASTSTYVTPAGAVAPPVGVALDAVVEEAVAREVVVDPHHVGRARLGDERLELGLADPPLHEPRPERVLAVDAPHSRSKRQPPPLVLQLGLLATAAVAHTRPRSSVCTRRALGFDRRIALHREAHGPRTA
jgi:hypothetical protein